MAMVKKILAKLKMNSTRIIAVALAAVILVLSVKIQPATAAAIPYAPGMEQIVIAIAGAAGISFASETDAQNFVSELKYYDASGALTQQLENHQRMIQANINDGKSGYITQAVDALGNTITEVSSDFTTGAKALYEIGMSEIESIFNTMKIGFDMIYNTGTADTIESGVLSNADIFGYIDGVALYDRTSMSLPKGYFDKIGIPLQTRWGNYYLDLRNTVNKAAFDSHNSIKYFYDKPGNLLHENKSFAINNEAEFQYEMISSVPEITESKPFTATLSPQSNIMTDTPAAVAAVAALGGVAAGARPGTYTDDDVIGLAIPLPGTGALTNFQTRDVVIDLDDVIDVDYVEIDPKPSPSISPSPSPIPIKVPSIPAILDLIKIAIENMNTVKDKAKETTADGGALDSALDNIVSDMTNIKSQLDNIPQDNPNDPNLFPLLDAAQNTITDLQNKIADLEKTVGTESEKYPDPALLEELQNLQNELEGLKNSMGTEPGNNPIPGTSPDYTNLLERILAILTDIKESIAAMPETLKETVIGSGELKPPNRDDDTDDDNDDDFDWTTIFPFCIPFDLLAMFKNLQAPPSPPYYEAEILGYVWVVDFSEYEFIVNYIRPGLMFSFVIWLIVMTSRLIKWH